MDAKTILNRVKKHTPTILGLENFSKFAVLIPLVQKDDGIHVLFEVRSHTLRRQPGEICFPGGKIDEQDQTEQDAAIRETTEELGINWKDIEDVTPVDYMVSPFDMIIYPYVGLLKHIENIDPNPTEVEETFTVPLSFFQETKPQVHQVNLHIQPDKDFPFELIVGGEDYNWRHRKLDEYFYMYGDKVIWGLTARIISRFVNMVQNDNK